MKESEPGCYFQDKDTGFQKILGTRDGQNLASHERKITRSVSYESSLDGLESDEKPILAAFSYLQIESIALQPGLVLTSSYFPL